MLLGVFILIYFKIIVLISCDHYDNYHRLGGLHHRNSFPHSSRSLKSETKMSSKLVPSDGSEGDFVSYLCPSSWWRPAILGFSWPVDMSLQSLSRKWTMEEDSEKRD